MFGFKALDSNAVRSSLQSLVDSKEEEKSLCCCLWILKMLYFCALGLQGYLRIYDGEIKPQVPILFQTALYSSAFSDSNGTLHCEYSVLKAS